MAGVTPYTENSWKKTNADRNCTENCADCWLDWLKQEVTDNSTT